MIARTSESPALGARVDRVVLAYVLDGPADPALAEGHLDIWKSDHPELGNLVEVFLVPPAADLRTTLGGALELVEPSLPVAREDGPVEQVAFVLVTPAGAVADYEDALHPVGEEPWALVLPSSSPAEAADIVADLARVCRLVLAGISDRTVPVVPVRPQPAPATPDRKPDPTLEPAPGPTPLEETPMTVSATRASITAPATAEDAEPTVHGRLLYVAWLGESPDGAQRAAERRWVSRTLDEIADRSDHHVVRMIALGDGICDQSDLAPASDFRSAPRFRRREKPWPRARGLLNMPQALSDLHALMERDLDRLAFEGIQVVERTCLVVVGDTPTASSSVHDVFALLGDSLRFLWVTPARKQVTIPEIYLAPESAEQLVEHRELDEEIVRKLNLRPRSTLAHRSARRKT